MQPPTTAKIIRNVNSHMCLYEVKLLTTRMNILSVTCAHYHLEKYKFDMPFGDLVPTIYTIGERDVSVVLLHG